jgi:hypothetical protein
MKDINRNLKDFKKSLEGVKSLVYELDPEDTGEVYEFKALVLDMIREWDYYIGKDIDELIYRMESLDK